MDAKPAPAETIQYYKTHPPSCLKPFLVEAVLIEGWTFDGHGSSGVYPDGLVEKANIVYAITCPCGHIGWQVVGESCFVPEIVYEPFFGAERIRLVCPACQKDDLLFDEYLHGYDAALELHFQFMEDDSIEDEAKDDVDLRDIEGMADHLQILRERKANGPKVLVSAPYRCPSCTGERFAILARTEQPGNLDEHAWHAGPREDLFSWFTLLGTCQQCGETQQIIDFECS